MRPSPEPERKEEKSSSSNKLTDFEKLTVTKGAGTQGRRDWGLGGAHAGWGVWNDEPKGICYRAQGILPHILWWSLWGKNLKENGCVYMHNWIILWHSKNDHKLVDQLYFNKALKKRKRKKTQAPQQGSTRVEVSLRHCSTTLGSP